MGLKEDYLNIRFGNDAHNQWLDGVISRSEGSANQDKAIEFDDTYIPTTTDFRIESNIQLGKYPELVTAFNRAISGQPVIETENISLIKALVGRDDFGVMYKNDSNVYNYFQDKISLSPNSTIAGFLNVKEENLPPNLPPEFTDELMRHLSALHEAEHVTQHNLSKEDLYISKTKKVSYVALEEPSSNILSSNNFDDLSFRIIKEADSDNTILNHLNDMGYGHLSQFWIDCRMKTSFDDQLTVMPYDSKAYEHDTASLLTHYRETGEIIDMKYFIEEKKSMMKSVSEEIGANIGTMISMLDEYVIPPFFLVILLNYRILIVPFLHKK